MAEHVWLVTTMKRLVGDDGVEFYLEEQEVHRERSTAADLIRRKMPDVWAHESARIREWVEGPPYPSSMHSIELYRRANPEGTAGKTDLEVARGVETVHAVFYTCSSPRVGREVLVAGGFKKTLRASVKRFEVR